MNKATRAAIAELVGKLEEIKDEIENLQSEEQDKFDNMPEGLQQSDNGQKCEAAAIALEDAVSSLDDAISSLEEASD
jgi:hypothetical protein